MHFQMTDQGFAADAAEYSPKQLIAMEDRLSPLLAAGDAASIQSLLREDPLLTQNDLFLLRVRTLEFLHSARDLCVRITGVYSWSYYRFYQAADQVRSARTSEAVLAILQEQLGTYAGVIRKFHEDRRAKNPVIQSCIRHIHQHMPGKMDVGMLADELHVSPKYLSPLFARETGQTLTSYITELRIDEAKRLLETTDMSLLEISEMLSFCSQSYFCTVFKGITGVTPNVYRLEVQKELLPR